MLREAATTAVFAGSFAFFPPFTTQTHGCFVGRDTPSSRRRALYINTGQLEIELSAAQAKEKRRLGRPSSASVRSDRGILVRNKPGIGIGTGI
jgi:hypothetical protein